MRIAAYQTLYESSLAFAVRKAVQGEDEKSELEMKVDCNSQAEMHAKSSESFDLDKAES